MADLAFSPVQTRRTFEEAVAQIAERITLGELHPGDQLPSERTLAQQMQISRPTVREALKLLADAGVVEVRPGARGGAVVLDGYVPREVLRRKSDLRVSEVGGVLEARRLLEPRVAQLAGLHARDTDLDAMERSIEGQRRIAGSGEQFLASEDRFLQLDLQFHLAIAKATGNSTVVSLMRSLLRRLEIARDMALHSPPVVEWSIGIHERTLSAIRAGDMDEIEAVMDEHLSALERTWERESGRALVRPLPGFLRPVAARAARAE
jgi:GntR family transcriptional regulator, transcriptional repressor for pyruvate dehydrogenase complex